MYNHNIVLHILSLDVLDQCRLAGVPNQRANDEYETDEAQFKTSLQRFRNTLLISKTSQTNMIAKILTEKMNMYNVPFYNSAFVFDPTNIHRLFSEQVVSVLVHYVYILHEQIMAWNQHSSKINEDVNLTRKNVIIHQTNLSTSEAGFVKKPITYDSICDRIATQGCHQEQQPLWSDAQSIQPLWSAAQSTQPLWLVFELMCVSIYLLSIHHYNPQPRFYMMIDYIQSILTEIPTCFNDDDDGLSDILRVLLPPFSQFQYIEKCSWNIHNNVITYCPDLQTYMDETLRHIRLFSIGKIIDIKANGIINLPSCQKTPEEVHRMLYDHVKERSGRIKSWFVQTNHDASTAAAASPLNNTNSVAQLKQRIKELEEQLSAKN